MLKNANWQLAENHGPIFDGEMSRHSAELLILI